MQLTRTVRRIDNLLELVIFDVLLATPRRRKVAAALGTLAALALYGISGLLFIPVVSVPDDPISCAPYIDDKTWVRPADEIGELMVDLDLTPPRMAMLARELPRHQAALDRLMSMLSDSSVQPSFTTVPWFRTTREAANLLTVRGLYLDATGRGDDAVRHWLAVSRLGRVLARGGGQAPMLIEGMIATAVQKVSLKALQRHADRGRMTPGQARRVEHEIGMRRSAGIPSLKNYIQGDFTVILRYLDRSVAAGGLSIDGDQQQSLRAVMPLRRGPRTAWLSDVRGDCAKFFATVLSRMDGKKLEGLDHETLRRLGAGSVDLGFEPGFPDGLCALFSSNHARKLTVAWLVNMMVPNFAKAGERLTQLEEKHDALEKSCREIGL